LGEVLRVDEEEVEADVSIAQLFDRYGGDSLDRVEFVMAIEEEFGDVEIPDEEVAGWEEWTQTWTVQQLAEFIDRHRRPPT
jgi:acyl carrier protein